MSKILAMTGHRPDKLGGYDLRSAYACRVRDAIRNSLNMIGDLGFVISGMALGVDQMAAEICIELGIPFVAAVPHEGQELMWPEAAQRHYHDLLSQSEKVFIISPGGYSAKKMRKRNEWMVDCCDILLAVWDGTTGGTSNCIKYAGRKDTCQVLRINPKEL